MAFGARFLKRIIDDRIKLPLSQRWKEANVVPGHGHRRQDRARGRWARDWSRRRPERDCGLK